jgi:hypothetical protein
MSKNQNAELNNFTANLSQANLTGIKGGNNLSAL